MTESGKTKILKNIEYNIVLTVFFGNYSKLYQKFNIIVRTIGKNQFMIYICKTLKNLKPNQIDKK